MIQLEKKSTRYADAVGKGLSAILGLMILILMEVHMAVLDMVSMEDHMNLI